MVVQLFDACRRAIMLGDKESAKELLADHEWLAKATDECGRSLLTCAAMLDKVRFVLTFLERVHLILQAQLCYWLMRNNVSPSMVDSCGRSPLHFAVMRHARNSMRVGTKCNVLLSSLCFCVGFTFPSRTTILYRQDRVNRRRLSRNAPAHRV